MSQEKIEVVADLKNLISGKFDDIMVKVDQFERKLNNVGQGGQKGIMGQVLGANLLTGAINRAGSALYDFGKGAFDAYGKSEQFLVSLTTMFKGNANEAKALDNQLKGFALETPFELTEIRDATKMMIAYGSQAGNVVEEMRMLGDISSGVGSSISEVAYLYGTLRTQGRAFARDIYQFTGRGIPIVKELAKVFHVTDSEVMKLVEDGKVGFKEVEKAMQSLTGTGGQFHDMMAAQSKTLLGQTSNLSDAWNQLQTSIGQSQSGILKGTVEFATDMVRAMGRIADMKNFKATATEGVSNDFKIDKKGFWSKFLGFGNTGTGAGDSPVDNRYFAFNENERKVFESKRDRDMFLNHDEKGKTFSAGGMLGTEAIFNMFASTMYDRFKQVSSSKNQTQDIAVFLRELTNERGNVLQGLEQHTISSVLGKNKLAVIDEAWKEVMGLQGLQKAKAGTEGGGTGSADKKPKELDTLAKMNRATQINVHIENLVRELTNNVETPKEALAMNTNEVAKALVAAVNDIYAAEK